MEISSYQKKVLSYGATALFFLFVGWQIGHNDVKLTMANGISVPKLSMEQPAELKNVNMTQFWQVWSIATSKYLEKDKIKPQDLVDGATAGLINALDDPYSVYLTPKQNTEAKADLEGTFEGVGMQLGYNKDKQLVVISPITESPADKAGVRAGDKIWKIDDKETPGMSVPEAVDLIRGTKGTKVKLTLQREGKDELFDVEITRDTIYVKSVELVLLENETVGQIKINRFGDPTKKEWDEAVDQIVQKGIKKVIVDVRNNPGGYLDTAVYINSDMMDGTVLQQENYLGQRKAYSPTRSQRLKDVKIVGLINKGSASASEIVAGGLQDRKRAQLVGETSFGKGTIQEVEDLKAGYGLHITTGKWLLPSGTWIHKIGLKPDFEVKLTEEDRVSKNDPQLNKAVELLK
jgi:carboxyl-terminal processing protease